MTETIKEQKKALRLSAKKRRDALFESGSAEHAVELLANQDLTPLEVAPQACIAGFASMSDEINVWPLLNHLHRNGFRLALPVITALGQPLIFRSWAPGDSMASGRWDIQEPLPRAAEVLPDVVLVPLLAFDKRGYRLGYGGGFYDRTLQKIREIKPVLAVGVGFDQQEVDVVPFDRYDQPLDWMLTPTRVLRCTDI